MRGHFFIADAKTLRECLDRGVLGDRLQFLNRRRGVRAGDLAWLYARHEDSLYGPFEVLEPSRPGTRDEANYAETFGLLTRVDTSSASTRGPLSNAQNTLRACGVGMHSGVPGMDFITDATLEELIARSTSGINSRAAAPSAEVWLPAALVDPAAEEAAFEAQVDALLRFLPLDVERWGAARPGSHPDGRARHAWDAAQPPLLWDAKSGRATSNSRPRVNDIRALTDYVSRAGREEGRFDFLVICARREKAHQYATCAVDIRDRTTELRHLLFVDYRALTDTVAAYLATSGRSRRSFDVAEELRRRVLSTSTARTGSK